MEEDESGGYDKVLFSHLYGVLDEHNSLLDVEFLVTCGW